jgi:hypothetical protein
MKMLELLRSTRSIAFEGANPSLIDINAFLPNNLVFVARTVPHCVGPASRRVGAVHADRADCVGEWNREVVAGAVADFDTFRSDVE